MKKVTKHISLLLVAVLLCVAVLSMVAHAARPRTFDKSKLKTIYAAQYPAELVIGDMTFHGVLKRSLSDAELDKLIEETLKEVGLTEEGFNKACEKRAEADAYHEKAKRMFSDGVADEMGLLPKEFSEKLLEGDIQGAYDILRGKWTYADGGAAAKFQKQLEELRLLDGYLKIEQEMRKDFAKLNNFYDKLDKNLRKQKMGWTLEFKNAKAAKQPFTLFNIVCFEEWTLNMALTKEINSINLPELREINLINMRNPIDGSYKGSYTIDIEYDLSNFQSNLRSNIWHMGEIGNSLAAITDNGPWNLASYDFYEGTCNVKRTLAGDATAKVNILFGDSITPTQKSDVKNVNFNGIVAHFCWKMSMSYSGISVDTDLFWDMELKADENGLKADFNNGHGATTNTLQGPVSFSESPFTVNIPWEGTIWDRGNRAGQGWKLKVVKG